MTSIWNVLASVHRPLYLEPSGSETVKSESTYSCGELSPAAPTSRISSETLVARSNWSTSLSPLPKPSWLEPPATARASRSSGATVGSLPKSPARPSAVSTGSAAAPLWVGRERCGCATSKTGRLGCSPAYVRLACAYGARKSKCPDAAVQYRSPAPASTVRPVHSVFVTSVITGRPCAAHTPTRTSCGWQKGTRAGRFGSSRAHTRSPGPAQRAAGPTRAHRGSWGPIGGADRAQPGG